LDQAIFRRDEIWFAERSRIGASRLIALSDFGDVRRDKDVRKSYLQGRVGGVPRINPISECAETEEGEER
jgi:hypothetical protein